MRQVKKKIEIVVFVLLSITIMFLFLIIALNKINAKYDAIIYNKISINGEDVGFKDKSEALNILNEEVIPELKSKSLNIKYDDKIFSYNINNYEGQFNVEKAIDDAQSYGKKENCFKKFYDIKIGCNKNYNIQFNISNQGYNKLIDDIKKDIDVKPENATITKKDQEFRITPDKKGIEVDLDDIKQKIDDALNYNIENEIDVKCNEVEARITAESLKKIKGAMGSFQTDYSSSSYARAKNIHIVTEEINGTVLMPGEEFSYGNYAKKGIGKYLNAPGYVDGQVVNVEGGGVCQPCTTLYRAVMKSNIRAVERHPHMFMVSYTKPGLDATLGNWGTLDYKFINTYDFPIYIEGIANYGIVKFTIYGDPSALNNCTYDMQSEVYGLTANSYLVTYDKNGKEIKREFISEDTYSSH